MYRVSLAVVTALAAAVPASAQTVLTLEGTLARVRESAGAVVVARARVAEAEASVVEAATRFRTNPELAIHAGPRSSGTGRTTDVEVDLSQGIETGGQRSARMLGARAGVARAELAVAVAARRSLIDAAEAFLDGLAATELLRIAEEADAVARNFLAAMERRYAAADVAAMDVNLARIDAARTAATLGEARAALIAASGRLHAMLRLPVEGGLSFSGSLDLPPSPPLESLRTLATQRPELTVLDAEAQEAAAQIQLGRSMRRPDIGLRALFAREQSDTIVLGGLSVSLPTAQRGQGALAAGVARASRVRLEREIEQARILAELDAAYAAHQQRVALAAAFTADAMPGVADNESLGLRSYDAGQVGLLDYLLIRRDTFEARRALVGYRLEAARSRMQLDYVSGALR